MVWFGLPYILACLSEQLYMYVHVHVGIGVWLMNRTTSDCITNCHLLCHACTRNLSLN